MQYLKVNIAWEGNAVSYGIAIKINQQPNLQIQVSMSHPPYALGLLYV
jgi:hypothetical protein